MFLAKRFPSLIFYVTPSLNANSMDSGTRKAGFECRLPHSWASLSLSFLIYKMKIIITPNSIRPNCCWGLSKVIYARHFKTVSAASEVLCVSEHYFSGPHSLRDDANTRRSKKPKVFLLFIWQQNLTWTNARLFIAFLKTHSVWIYTHFCCQYLHVFDYTGCCPRLHWGVLINFLKIRKILNSETHPAPQVFNIRLWTDIIFEVWTISVSLKWMASSWITISKSTPWTYLYRILGWRKHFPVLTGGPWFPECSFQIKSIHNILFTCHNSQSFQTLGFAWGKKK